jgi:glucose-1-phosphate thymidylyltransferase
MDKIDSQTLAHLLRANLLPAAYVPDHPIRFLRMIVRHRGAAPLGPRIFRRTFVPVRFITNWRGTAEWSQANTALLKVSLPSTWSIFDNEEDGIEDRCWEASLRTIILAGGYARRLWPLTQNRPKPLLPVAGKPIIEYILQGLQGTPIVSINRRFAPQFEEWAAGYPKAVELVVEETHSEEEKLGSVRALTFLVKELRLQEEVMVLAGDNIIGFDLQEFTSRYRGRPLIALHDLGDPERAKEKYGTAQVAGSRIISFQEKAERPRSALASTACYIYPPGVFPFLERFTAQAGKDRDAPGFFNQWLLEQGVELEGFIFNERWFDIGDRASYIQANLEILGDDVYRGQNVVITDSTIRRSVILDDVRIEGSLIADCVIDSGCELRNVELRECLIGEGTRITRG